MPEITHHCPKTPFLLVGTQIDLRDDQDTIEKLSKARQRPISVEAAENLARELGARLQYKFNGNNDPANGSFLSPSFTLLLINNILIDQ